VRRWDEAAKDPAAPTPAFEHFRPLLARLVDELTPSLDQSGSTSEAR